MTGSVDRPAGPVVVDVLLATYNGVRHLPGQLQSLLEQSHQRFRLLVSDDGSSDGTQALLQQWLPRFDGRMVLLDNPAPGRGVARNFEFLMQSSLDDGVARYAAFCDQDDVWLPPKLATLLAALQELEQRRGAAAAALVHCDLAVVGPGLEPIHPSFVRHQRLLPVPGSDVGLLSINQVTGCAMLVNRALLQAALPLPGSALMHDWWCALLAAGGGRQFVDQALVLYRQHGANQLGAKGRSLHQSLLRLLREGPAVLRRVRALGRGTLAQAIALRQRLDERRQDSAWVADYLAWRERPLRRRVAGWRSYYGGPLLDGLSRLLLW